MNKEVYKEMCCEIYEGESWDRMINCLERKDKEIERLNKALLDIKEYVEINQWELKENGYDDDWKIESKPILDIVNKTLGSDKE